VLFGHDGDGTCHCESVDHNGVAAVDSLFLDGYCEYNEVLLEDVLSQMYIN
jgi:hypothetical protein